MVESNDGGGLAFDDLNDEVDFNGIRDRQQSCYAKDLSKEETPEFLRKVN